MSGKECRGGSEITEFLLAQGAEANKLVSNGYLPIHAASENGETEVLKILLKNGADLAVKNRHGNTALHAAVIGHILPDYQANRNPFGIKKIEKNGQPFSEKQKKKESGAQYKDF